MNKNKRTSCAKSAPAQPASTSTPTPKQNPSQMQSTDYPKTFATVKAALYVHIKILWGLLEQDSVPKGPSSELLTEFYSAFSTVEEIETVAQASSPPDLIPRRDIQFGRGIRLSQSKAAKSVGHLSDSYVCYIKSALVCFGLQVWSPNLEENSDSFYNSACRISAIASFRQIAAAGAYNYVNINLAEINNVRCLIEAFNHFVFFHSANRYKKEIQSAGKNKLDASMKVIQQNQSRVSSQYEFAVANQYPERYQKVLKEIEAHSNDERHKKKNIFVIKTLLYRSKNASRFIQRLDQVMIKAAQNDPRSSASRRCVRLLPKEPCLSCYSAPPKGFPIDFYCPHWFKELTPSQQQLIPNLESVAFLPDASLSLLPKKSQFPDEKLTNQSFTRKYLDGVLASYGLVDNNLENDMVGGDSELYGGKEDDEEGIDLADASPDISEEEFLPEGESGDLYDETFIDDDEYSNPEDNEEMDADFVEGL
ncbi:hypothetical protein PTTG_01835 [Puccinia triticina 1-1 BBBD Race 1]|uniref:Uncharacterized protein n=1 Tax=Puccinia triticina (isolate 1-1 / race 1 (BBBD)) TaxID=630390 RepID=A0A180GPH0_PUCT1|nr:hypothetical protein PTTG_01835 [Puccinia triticina 1-1 BBBD Race 1]